MNNIKSLQLFILLTVISVIAFTFYDDDNSGNQGEYYNLSFNAIDANTIRAWFRNDGSFNHNYTTGGPGFEWPKGYGSYARLISGIWIGARVSGDTFVSKSDYESDFAPGYTDNYGIPHGTDDPDYRVYKLTYGIKDKDRQKWPNALLGNSDQGAPVYFDVLSNRWKPLDFGHQTMFYVFTDSYRSEALKADVKMINYALDLIGPAAQIIFSHIKIINRSTNVWNDAYISIWTDDNIGAPLDDGLLADSSGQTGITYSLINNNPQYGTSPPAVSFVMINGADDYTGNINDTTFICEGMIKKLRLGYKNVRMTVFNGGAPEEFNPVNKAEAYRVMSGLNQDGTPIIHPHGYITKFKALFLPGDQRSLISTGPVSINPRDTQDIVIAQVVVRGSSNLNSISTLRTYSYYAKRFYDECVLGLPPIEEVPPANLTDFRLFQNYPNPFNPDTKIKFELPNLSNTSMQTHLAIYDLLGREIIILVNQPLDAGEYEVVWNGALYPSGVYFCKLTVRPSGFIQTFSETRKMLLLK